MFDAYEHGELEEHAGEEKNDERRREERVCRRHHVHERVADLVLQCTVRTKCKTRSYEKNG